MAKLAEAVLLDVWNTSERNELTKIDNLGLLQTEYQTQIDNLVELVSKTNDSNLVDIYQRKIKDLQAKLKVEEEPKEEDIRAKYTPEQFGTALKQTIQTLENPLKEWKTRKIEVKRNLINFYFDKPLTYDKDIGFGTVEYRDEINVLHNISTGNCSMVEMGGIEPPC